MEVKEQTVEQCDCGSVPDNECDCATDPVCQELAEMAKDIPATEDLQALDEFAKGWDRACAKLKAIIEAEDAAGGDPNWACLDFDTAWDEAHLYNDGYDAGYVDGLIEGSVGSRPVMLHEWLSQFPDFAGIDDPGTKCNWLYTFGRVAKMLGGKA